MTEALVLRENKNGTAFLTLNRPDKLNALTVSMFEELRRHVQQIDRDDAVKCVVISGAGKCFSAGHDLADIASGERVPSRGWHSETLRMMERLAKPVIAAVHGHCYTGALEVALAADFIVAAESAKFADTHSKWALTPVWGMSQRLPRRVGVATAMGLAELVLPADSFMPAVEAFCEQICANSSFSHAANKRLLEATDGGSMDGGLQWEIFMSEGHGPDMAARIGAFTKK
jgi:enoyl-CoA hydratase